MGGGGRERARERAARQEIISAYRAGAAERASEEVHPVPCKLREIDRFFNTERATPVLAHAALEIDLKAATRGRAGSAVAALSRLERMIGGDSDTWLAWEISSFKPARVTSDPAGPSD